MVSAFLPASGWTAIGEFHCALIEPLPLTSERIATIQLDLLLPAWSLGVDSVLSSTEYTRRLNTCRPRRPKDSFWYEDIAEHFVCECGKTRLDLGTVKRNFFAVLEKRFQVSGQVIFARLYGKRELESLRDQVVNLIAANPSVPEETLQKFIANNTILLHQWPSEKLRIKHQIRTQFNGFCFG
jgi:hypothetical protein